MGLHRCYIGIGNRYIRLCRVINVSYIGLY